MLLLLLKKKRTSARVQSSICSHHGGSTPRDSMHPSRCLIPPPPPPSIASFYGFFFVLPSSFSQREIKRVSSPLPSAKGLRFPSRTGPPSLKTKQQIQYKTIWVDALDSRRRVFSLLAHQMQCHKNKRSFWKKERKNRFILFPLPCLRPPPLFASSVGGVDDE